MRGDLGGASLLFGGIRARSISSGDNKKTGEKGGIVDHISDSDSDDNEAEEDGRAEKEIDADELRGGIGRGKGKGNNINACAEGFREVDHGENDDLEPMK